MSWFKRTPAATFDGLDEALGRPAQPLAHGTGAEAVLVGTRESLALRSDGTWTVWPWQQVAGGSWNGEAKTFTIRTVEGDKFVVALEEVGLLPQLFRERIEASTVVQSVIDTPRGRVQVVGRRGLGDDHELRFFAVPSAGADLLDEATRQLVVAETDRLRAEYF